MVGQLIRLKTKITWNTLHKQTGVLILYIIMSLGAILYLAGAFIGLAYVSLSDEVPTDILAAGIVVGGALFVVLWILLPLLFQAVNNALDPRRFGPYIGEYRPFGRALLVASGFGIGGLFSAIVCIMPTLTWILRGEIVAGIVSIAGSILGLSVAVTWSQVVSTWFGTRMSSSSKRKDLVNIIAALLFLAFMMPLNLWVREIFDNFSTTGLSTILTFAAWTPLGAPWAVALSVYTGSWAAAIGQLAVSLATLTLGYWVWQRLLPRVIRGTASPVTPQINEALKTRRSLVDPSGEGAKIERPRAGTTEKWFDGVAVWKLLGANNETASLAHRTFLYWKRDSRLVPSLVLCSIMPFIGIIMSGPDSFKGYGIALCLLCAFTLGNTVGVLQQFDSTALWILVASGIRGRDERYGRLLGSLPYILVCVLLTSTIFAVTSGYDTATALRFMTLQILMFSAMCTVCMVVSAKWVYQVQPPGASAMSMNSSGNVGASLAISGSELGLAAVAMAPGLVILGLSQWTPYVPVFVACPLGVAWSVGLLVVGVIVGGRLWDSSKVAVLEKIRNWPGHGIAVK